MSQASDGVHSTNWESQISDPCGNPLHKLGSQITAESWGDIICGKGGGVGAGQLVVAVMDSGKLEHSLSKTAEGRKPQPSQAAAFS